jgi:arylsulfatase
MTKSELRSSTRDAARRNEKQDRTTEETEMASSDHAKRSAPTVGRTVADAQPHWDTPPHPGPDAPNVVYIVLDDLGFAQLGCYGASIETPSIDRLAQGGIRYTNFHVTAMCSPTRTCLLTGRNHHAVGMGYLADFDTGFANSRGAISPKAATIADMLSATGYGAYALGKWHLTPPSQMSPAGPFVNWPTQRGFDRFYGFLGGEEDQWAPELWYDQHHVPPPAREGYHLSEDLAGRACEFLSDHLTASPDRPFLLYLAFGACHAPHQSPRSFIEKYRGRFDHGWDVERERVLAKQKKLGIVPENTRLAPLNPGQRSWTSLNADEKRLAARMQEVFAGFTEHTDTQIGKVVSFLERQGKLDNTLIVLLSDNGASGEGGEHGSVNEYRYFLGLQESFEENLAAIDDLGGPHTHNHYPTGWAQAGNTPLKFFKKYTFGGGVRAPLIMHWPNRLKANVHGSLRPQFHHAIDIVPTLLELTGAPAPAVHHGIEQFPVHGISMLYTFDHAEETTRRETQYFEMGGQRGIWHKGWKAVTNHRSGTSYDDDVWELYDLASDYSETRDRAADQPERVKQMAELWWQEAYRNGVLPLDDRAQARAFARDPRTDRRKRFVLLPGSRLLTPVTGPNFSARSFKISAETERDDAGAQGVLMAYGRRAAGLSLFVQGNRLIFDYNLAGRHTLVQSDIELPLGRHMLGCSLIVEGTSAYVRLFCDNRELARQPVPQAFPAGFGVMPTQCGINSPSPVSDLYEAPFTFSGLLHRVVVDLDDETEATITGQWEAAHRSQ